MTRDDISAGLLSFIRQRFLDDDFRSQLEETTPLLEWGILNSMNTAVLLSFIRTEFGREVPPASFNAENFRNVNAIASMIMRLAAASVGD